MDTLSVEPVRTTQDANLQMVASALAIDLANDADWDLLTTLLWVACENIDHVAYLRAAGLSSGLAFDYVNIPDQMADDDALHAQDEGCQVVNTRPSFTLHRALSNGIVSARGTFAGEREPRLISKECWSQRGFSGGLFGKKTIGSAGPIGPDQLVSRADITGLLFSANEVMNAFGGPLAISKRGGDGNHSALLVPTIPVLVNTTEAKDTTNRPTRVNRQSAYAITLAIQSLWHDEMPILKKKERDKAINTWLQENGHSTYDNRTFRRYFEGKNGISGQDKVSAVADINIG